MYSCHIKWTTCEKIIKKSLDNWSADPIRSRTPNQLPAPANMYINNSHTNRVDIDSVSREAFHQDELTSKRKHRPQINTLVWNQTWRGRLNTIWCWWFSPLVLESSRFLIHKTALMRVCIYLKNVTEKGYGQT